MSNELFVPVVGYEGIYEVSNIGNVKSLAGVDTRGHNRIEKILKARLSSSGYKRVLLSKEGVGTDCSIHYLVLLSFVGTRPLDYDIDHIDGNKSNNHIDNLEYVTHRENISRGFIRKKCTSRYTGVSLSHIKQDGSICWVAIIYKKSDNKSHRIGTFGTELEAYNAYLGELNGMD